MKHFFQQQKISFQENKPLAPLTTWRVGGEARYFIPIQDEQTLVKVLKLNQKTKRLPIFVLGGGSNVLISDKGFPGIVLHVAIDTWKVKEYKNYFRIIAGAGNKLSKLVDWGKKEKLDHILVFAKIPGTIGGAVVGNAGAWGHWIANYITSVTYFDFQGRKYVLKKTKKDFSYRQSIFKKKKKIVITEIEFKIPKKHAVDKKLVEQNLEYRSKTQPKGFSAGCVFANPSGHFAGILIDQAGCKGLTIGDVFVSPIHSNFFINKGKAKAADIYKLIQTVKKEVEKQKGIKLREEIRYVGKF